MARLYRILQTFGIDFSADLGKTCLVPNHSPKRNFGTLLPATNLLTRDGVLLFSTRILRLFGYGFLSVVLLLYLAAAGLNEAQMGLLLTLTLVGDTAVSLWITTAADRIGRRRMLIAGAMLMVLAGTLFSLTTNAVLLLVAATIGVISPSGNEVGPFLSIEQAALAQIVPGSNRVKVFAWYNLLGSFATALGALAGGALAQTLLKGGLSPLASYRAVVIGYGATGIGIALLFMQLSPTIEASAMVAQPEKKARTAALRLHDRLGLSHSGRVVLKLSALFSLDAFAGGFVLQSVIAYWFHLRFGVEPAALGGIFFGANILAGLSALAATRLASRFGLINTMVFTHIPSNILLILVPFMPSLSWTVAVLLVRFSISQMDVPTRQAYTFAIVPAQERSAAAGVTAVARSVGSSLAPALVGRLMSASFLNAPFYLAGGLKIVYDLLLYRSFRTTETLE